MVWVNRAPHTHTQNIVPFQSNKRTELFTFESPGKFHAEQNVGQLGLGISIEGTVLPSLPVQVFETQFFGWTDKHQPGSSFDLLRTTQVLCKDDNKRKCHSW